MKLLVCFGTRPEYIKVKSIIENIPDIKTCFTGQHKDLLKEVKADYVLDMSSMHTENRLNNIFANILPKSEIFNDVDSVMVQGDTSTALAIAISAFHHGKKIVHLEAGLRSNDLYDPFPEEMNRQVISRIANIHLCPTDFNKQNLAKEGVTKNVYVTGNTGLDNITRSDCVYGNKVLITLHRRDNHPIMDQWFQELSDLAEKYNNLEFIIPLHPNPDVQKHKWLLENVKIINPLSHPEMITLMKECKFIISDSGGLQEEASFLNKKIIVCRRTTERPETVGTHSAMCPYPEDLFDVVDSINGDYRINAECPYGDGFAWKKVLNVLEKHD
jgi:UDP-N-acetylglucosamine 2-epimerase (non-hydrolysing)